MSLVRFDLDNEFDELRRELNPFYSTVPRFPGILSSGAGRGRFLPAMDTVERDGTVYLSVDLPGLSEEDVDVEIQGNMLTIRGTRTVDEEDSGDTWYRSERSIGSFERALRLPEPIDVASVRASFDKGVLTVAVPIPSHETAEPQKVAITTAGRT